MKVRQSTALLAALLFLSACSSNSSNGTSSASSSTSSRTPEEIQESLVKQQESIEDSAALSAHEQAMSLDKSLQSA